MGTSERPNVIVILSDDQGAWAMGCAGNGDVRTPHLDRLAASGTRFENFFCASPVCSPARASLLTGRIPSQHGIHDWLASGNIERDALDPSIRGDDRFGRERHVIDFLRGKTTYTDVLAANGYTCGLSGKWHVGDSARPRDGFAHWFALARGGCGYYEPDVVRDGKVRIESAYISDLITQDALAFLDSSAASAPFYLSVHYTAPHSPWDQKQHPAGIWDSYAGCSFSATPDEPLHPWQISSCPHGEGERRKELLRGYYTAITAMDAGIGLILDKLEALGLRGNTLVFFTSDNGMNLGHHGIWGKGNGTFPLNMFDTSVKVPAIASLPGAVPAGQTCGALLSHYDFMPTLLDYLDITGPRNGRTPGRSFAPVLRGDALPEGGPIFVCDEYGPVRMVRTREWKYVHRHPYGPHECYDLVRDPGERINLFGVSENLEQVRQMKETLDDWFAGYVDPAVDGTHEEVYGSGQIGIAGPAGKGLPAFGGPHTYVRNNQPAAPTSPEVWERTKNPAP